MNIVLSIVFLIGVVFNVIKFVQAFLLYRTKNVKLIAINQMKTHSIGAVWDFIWMLVCL